MEKQNKTQIKKIQTKVVDSMIFEIFSKKQAIRKLSGIKFKYTYRLYLVLLNKNHPHKFPIY